ncbi:hypothetical protein [Aeromicrobium fastidiosum]|uniref:hypothetical protein n=2 Tax=Aeromicrobium fastidiosum TaxID=52699 RepID=UPI001AE6C210|nr:hypothetical protein [Aeromicrobium fastidiosum]MBP2389370.1 hypothetical protein [Aeromicrobium fastidiosum]
MAPLSGSKGKAAMASLGSGPGNSEELAMQLTELLDVTREQSDLLAAVADRDITPAVDGRQAGTIYKAGEHAAGRLGRPR